MEIGNSNNKIDELRKDKKKQKKNLRTSKNSMLRL